MTLLVSVSPHLWSVFQENIFQVFQETLVFLANKKSKFAQNEEENLGSEGHAMCELWFEYWPEAAIYPWQAVIAVANWRSARRLKKVRCV